jgi:hypothetical protein
MSHPKANSKNVLPKTQKILRVSPRTVLPATQKKVAGEKLNPHQLRRISSKPWLKCSDDFVECVRLYGCNEQGDPIVIKEWFEEYLRSLTEI